MQKRQIQSAPPTGRRRPPKTTALNDIEEWVYSNKDLVNGKSTEQRLLRAKLLELGKERFKLKTKLSYDIEKFVEKQTRNGLMNKRSRPSSATGLTSVETTSLRSRRAGVCQSAPINRTRTPMRTKTVQFQPELRRHAEYLTTGILDPHDEDALWGQVTQNGGTFIGLQPCTSGIPLNTEWSRPSTAGTPAYSRPVSSFSQNDLLRSRKDNRLSNYGARFPSVTGDPRFSKLHKALSQNYLANNKDSVFSIIQRIESLRQPLKTGTKEARRDLELKIKLFMEENHIVF